MTGLLARLIGGGFGCVATFAFRGLGSSDLGDSATDARLDELRLRDEPNVSLTGDSAFVPTLGGDVLGIAPVTTDRSAVVPFSSSPITAGNIRGRKAGLDIAGVSTVSGSAAVC